MLDKITFPIQNLNSAIIEVWKWKVILSHTLLGKCLLIHAGIKVTSC